ncbi:MAG TPA: deoxynucleoside kinase [Chloroflexia bacterium]|nr:deoxynucleoside kinase [Chloroflexia bacterium]
MTYLVIEGVIGVGKTALTRLLGEQFGVPTLFEQFEENPFLGKFYADREQYAFQTEVFFLLNRYRQQEAVVKHALAGGDGHSLVGDYLFAKTRLFAGLNLRGAELALFDEIYEALSRQVAVPDLVVYLTASVDTLMSRIYQRDRSIERAMQREYIADLARLYDSFFDGYQDTPLAKIDTDSLDFMRSTAALQEVVRTILQAAGVGSLRSKR